MDQFRLFGGQPALNNAAINQCEYELLPTSENCFENVEFHRLFAQ